MHYEADLCYLDVWLGLLTNFFRQFDPPLENGSGAQRVRNVGADHDPIPL